MRGLEKKREIANSEGNIEKAMMNMKEMEHWTKKRESGEDRDEEEKEENWIFQKSSKMKRSPVQKVGRLEEVGEAVGREDEGEEKEDGGKLGRVRKEVNKLRGDVEKYKEELKMIKKEIEEMEEREEGWQVKKEELKKKISKKKERTDEKKNVVETERGKGILKRVEMVEKLGGKLMEIEKNIRMREREKRKRKLIIKRVQKEKDDWK